MKRTFLKLIACAVALVGSDGVMAETSPRAQTALGTVRGLYADAEHAIEVYKGIPYALPPTGSRRWKYPEPTGRWPETLSADRFGPDCVQPATMDVSADPEKDWYYHAPSLVSEDCLYLNIWTPSRREEQGRAVMVWIHGGGYVQGSGSWPLYDGTQLARKGVVLVTLNYRLGIFGRFAHPQLTAESPQRSSGAYDLADQIRALEWIAQNIAAFGGDPRNVTIFGESAGSVYVNLLLSSPQARGLFHRAIGESGGALYDLMPSLVAAESAGVAFSKSVAHPTLAGLRELPASQLLQMAREQKYYVDPVVDGHFLPQTPCKVLQAGQQTDVPVLLGFNSDEHHGYRPPLPVFKNYGEFEKYARGALAEMAYANPGIADGFIALLPKSRWTPQAGKRLMRGYAITGWEMESWAALTGKVSSPAYLYYFNHAPAGSDVAYHTAEIPFVFNNERDTPRYSSNMPAVPARPADLALAEAMSDYWVAFAKTGVPAVKDQPQWKRYDAAGGRHFMEFKAGAPVPAEHFFPDIQHKPICEVLK